MIAAVLGWSPTEFLFDTLTPAELRKRTPALQSDGWAAIILKCTIHALLCHWALVGGVWVGMSNAARRIMYGYVVLGFL